MLLLRPYRLVLVALVVLWAVEPTEVSAHEPLQEGFSIGAGTGTHDRHRLEMRLDHGLIPIPIEGRARLNTTHAMVGIGTDRDFRNPDLDRLRLQLMDWPHLRLLGVERQRDEGLAIGINAAGGSIPLRIAGKKESRNWILGHIGIDLGYGWYRQHFGAREDGSGAQITPGARLDQQVDIFERLSLRAWQQASYTALIGRFGDRERIHVQHQVLLEGALGLYLDITPTPLYREIPRTDPETGEVTYRRSVNQGFRWRWMIARVSGDWHPIGDVTGLRHTVEVVTGIERSF